MCVRKSFCPDCKKEEGFKLFLDITQESEAKIEVLAGCRKCSKGKWIELSPIDYEKLVSEQEDMKKGK